MDLLGMYHLLVAPEVAKDLHAWEVFYDYYPVLGRRPTVILDNGAFEGDCWPPEALHIIASTLAHNADVVVCLPDVLHDGKLTQMHSLQAMEKYPHLLDTTPTYSLAYIAQGRYFDEVTYYIDSFFAHEVAKYVQHVYVPRLITKHLGSRLPVVEWIRRRSGIPQNVHLLGFSGDLDDDIDTLVRGRCIGIDSAEPIWWEQDARGTRPDDYWRWQYLPESAVDNIARIREMIEACKEAAVAG